MHSFISRFRNSISKSEIYEKPENNLPGQAIKYILLLAIVLGLVKAVILGVTMVPAVGDIKQFVLGAMDSYPEDLVLTLKNGKLSTNRSNPFIVPVKEGSKGEDSYENILVIDTAKKLDLEAFEDYKTNILITEDGFMAMEDSGIRVQSFKDFPDYTLSKSVIDRYKGKVEVFAGGFSIFMVIILSVLLWVVMFVATFAAALFMSLLGSLLALVVTKAKGYSLSFSQLYALSLYAMTAVLFIGTLKFIVPVSSWVSVLAFVLVLSLLVPKKPAGETIPPQA